MIFTHEMAQKLWDFTKQNPVPFDTTKFTPTAVPEFNITLNSGDVNINMGGIVMNGVNDPEGFINEMNKKLATKSKTIKILQTNTIGSLSKNYNSLGTRKYL